MQNRDRDLIFKREQYAARGVLEYWLISPDDQSITVLRLQDDAYIEVGTYQNLDVIDSPAFPALQLTAGQVFQDSLQP